MRRETPQRADSWGTSATRGHVFRPFIAKYKGNASAGARSVGEILQGNPQAENLSEAGESLTGMSQAPRNQQGHLGAAVTPANNRAFQVPQLALPAGIRYIDGSLPIGELAPSALARRAAAAGAGEELPGAIGASLARGSLSAAWDSR